MEDQQSNYLQSEFLRREATNAEGEIIPDLWQAIVAREVAVDEIVRNSDADNREILDATGYLQKAKRVRELQEIYGIEQK